VVVDNFVYSKKKNFVRKIGAKMACPAVRSLDGNSPARWGWATGGIAE